MLCGTQVPEDRMSDVVISQPAAMKLATHLTEQGRLQGGVSVVNHKLSRAIAQKWGTAARQFTDHAGVGWLIDLSEYFDDEMLYAVVRSHEGSRTLVAVVDADELEGFAKTQTWKTPEAGLGADQVPGGETVPTGEDPSAHTNSSARAPALKAQPDDPRLIVWWEGPAPKDSETRSKGEAPQAMHTTYAEAQGIVMGLLMKGCKVEVWSGVKHPQLKVDI